MLTGYTCSLHMRHICCWVQQVVGNKQCAVQSCSCSIARVTLSSTPRRPYNDTPGHTCSLSLPPQPLTTFSTPPFLPSLTHTQKQSDALCGSGIRFIFIENICNDPDILQQNYLNKMRYSPDYANIPTEKVWVFVWVCGSNVM